MTLPSPRLPMLAATAAVAVCLGFAFFTGHIWEDYLITFRSSLNLATGHGLVYQPGERLHTFTSPLGTLLPALFAIGGGDAVARALWCFRVVSALALGGALWLAMRTQLRAGLAPFAVAAAGALWVFDAKTVDFAINGQEAALLVFFVVLTWHAFVSNASIWRLALGCAGLQWTRPDGCVFFGALALGWLVFGEKSALAPRRRRFRTLGSAVALAIVLYLPWLIFAWVYYGSPVPHTIDAKVTHYMTGELLRAWALYPWRLLFGHTALHDLFRPAYFYFGGWPATVEWLSRLLAVGAALAWAWPAVRPAGRVAALAFFLGGFYVEYIPRSPWYYPVWQALAFVTWAFLFDALGHTSVRFTRVLAGVLIVAQLAVLLAVAWQVHVQQIVIERGERTVIGRWLHDHAAPGERVYLEPLGYIGFYSGLKMLDYPGLSSREVVAARRAGAKPHAGLIAALRPDWLVLRADQVEGVRAEMPRLLVDDYRLARIFDVRPALDAVALLPGRGYLEFDARYFVFARAAAGATPPAR